MSEQPDAAPPAPMRSQAAVRELGYAATPAAGRGWWHVDMGDEETPELRWPDNLAVYEAMAKQDAQVGSVLRAVTHPIRRTPWRIDPAGARDEVVELVARDLGLPIKGSNDEPTGRMRDRFSWQDHLRQALLMLRYGHMVFEQVYRYDEASGLMRLRKLGPRMPRSIARFNVARDGGLVSVEQHPVLGETRGVTLPVGRVVVYCHEREGANWQGSSLLRQAYKNWLIKDRLLRTHAQTIDRNGMGVPTYTAAPGETSLKAGLEIATSVRAGDNSGVAKPHDSDFKLLGVEGQIPDALPGIRYHDEQIARAVLAHFLNLGSAGAGHSYALGVTLGDFFTGSLQATGDDIAQVTTAHVVEDLVDINYGPDEPAPRVVLDDIGSQTAALATAVKLLVDAGVLTPDESLEAHVRLGLGLPAPDPTTAREPQTGDAA